VGIEGAVFTWLPYYAGTFFERDLANATLSVYLLAYVPGRVEYTALVDCLSYLTLLAGIGTLSVPALAVALVGTTGIGVLVGTFAAGLLVSGFFPVLSAYGVDAAPDYSGPVNATTGATYVGLAVVPVVMGVIAERASIERAMWVPVGLAVALAVLLLALRATTVSASAPMATD
jgi:fucose permease